MSRSITLVAVCALVIGGCLRPARIASVDSPILVRVHETLSPDGRTLQLGCATEQIYGCFNYHLGSSQVRYGSTIFVTFTGVTAPNVCLTATGPATTSIPLGRLRDGTYRLGLSANGTTTSGVLQIDRDSVVVRGGEGRWTKFPRPVLHRVPPGTLWGVIGWGPSDQSRRAQAFLDSLQVLGARALLLAPGDYDFFQVGPDGTVLTPETTGYYFARAFALRYDGDHAALPGVVRAFSDSLWISMYGDRGESWLSWVLRAGT